MKRGVDRTQPRPQGVFSQYIRGKEDSDNGSDNGSDNENDIVL